MRLKPALMSADLAPPSKERSRRFEEPKRAYRRGRILRKSSYRTRKASTKDSCARTSWKNRLKRLSAASNAYYAFSFRLVAFLALVAE
jgi:hypothetical protein